MSNKMIFWFSVFGLCMTMIVWLHFSIIASGFKIAYESCGPTGDRYPIEYVLYTNMFCPVEEKNNG